MTPSPSQDGWATSAAGRWPPRSPVPFPPCFSHLQYVASALPLPSSLLGVPIYVVFFPSRPTLLRTSSPLPSPAVRFEPAPVTRCHCVRILPLQASTQGSTTAGRLTTSTSTSTSTYIYTYNYTVSSYHPLSDQPHGIRPTHFASRHHGFPPTDPPVYPARRTPDC